jgi:hypothetical protein
MKRFIATVLLSAAAFVAFGAASAFADPISLVSPGQHNQSCQDLFPSSPGNASSARGSAFNENGGIAGGVYASIAQYDVACAQQSFH